MSKSFSERVNFTAGNMADLVDILGERVNELNGGMDDSEFQETWGNFGDVGPAMAKLRDASRGLAAVSEVLRRSIAKRAVALNDLRAVLAQIDPRFAP